MQNTPPSLDALLQEVDWLRRLCQALTQSREDADDLAQDVLDRALRQRPVLEPRGSGLRGWLATVARRRAGRVREKARTRTGAEAAAASKPPGAPGYEPSPQERTHDYAVLQRDLAAAIAELPEADRTIVVARYLESRPYQDIAAELGISVDTARHRCSRALQRLRSKLEQEDPRWSQWLPAIASGTPYIPSGPTGTSPILSASALKLVAIAATITLIAVGAWAAVRMTARGPVDSHAASGSVSLLEPPQLAAGEPQDSLAAPRQGSGTSSHENIAQASQPADFRLTNEDGEPIQNALALWITGRDRRLVNVAVDTEGYGRVESSGEAEARESGCLFVVADGYLGRPYYGVQVTDDEIDTLTMKRATALRLVIDSVQREPIPAFVLGCIAVSPIDIAASPLLESAEVREALRKRLLPDGLVTASQVANAGLAAAEFDLTLAVETADILVDLSDGLRIVSAQGPGVRVAPNPGIDMRVLMDDVTGSGATIHVRIEPLPHVDLTLVYEGGEPFRGLVRTLRFFPDAQIDMGSRAPVDATGKVRVATTRRGEFEGELPTSVLEKIWLNFESRDGTHIDHIEFTADQLSSEPRTLILPKPRPYTLRFVDASAEDRTAVNARVFGARDHYAGQTTLDAEGALTSSTTIHGLPGDTVSIAAPGYRVENLTLPPRSINEPETVDLVVRLHPHPTFEVLYDPKRLRGARVLLASVDGTAPLLTFSRIDQLSAGRNYTRRTKAATDWSFEPSTSGKTIIPGVRPDHALEISIVDLFGETLLERTCRLEDSPIDFTDETAELVRVVGSVTNAQGEPVAAGRLMLDTKNGTSRSEVAFVGGTVDIGPLKPGRYELTAASWDGASRTQEPVRFRLRQRVASKGPDWPVGPIVLSPEAPVEAPVEAQ